MSTLVTLFRVLVDVYHLLVALSNACTVFIQVLRSAMQEAQQEAADVLALLDDGAPTTDAMRVSASLLAGDVADAKDACQMLIIARTSSFVLLLRLSKHRVLHLQVDERFVASKLEVIQTELALSVQHVPRLLRAPIGMHDTRLVRYTPMKLPYLWREEETVSERDNGGGGGTGEVVESPVTSTAPVPPASAISTSMGAGAEPEGRSHRKKYVQLLADSALRRRLDMDRLGRDGLDAGPKRGTVGIAKRQGEVKRKALANATNASMAHAEGGADTVPLDAVADGGSEDTQGLERAVADTPKQVRMERHIHAALRENVSLPNMAQAAMPSRKAVESVQQQQQQSLRRMGHASLRRKRGQFDLYAQGVPNEFTLVPKTDRGRD